MTVIIHTKTGAITLPCKTPEQLEQILAQAKKRRFRVEILRDQEYV